MIVVTTPDGADRVASSDEAERIIADLTAELRVNLRRINVIGSNDRALRRKMLVLDDRLRGQGRVTISDGCIQLKSLRLEQWTKMVSLVVENPSWSISRAAKEAIASVKGEGGYTSDESLARYASYHKNLLTEAKRNAKRRRTE